MSILNCLETARRMGVITSDEHQQLRDRYESIAKETADTAEARARMQKEIEAEAQHRERVALLTEFKRTSIMKALQEYRNASGEANMLEAWIAMHENFGRIGTFIQDAEGLKNTIQNKAQSDLRLLMKEGARGAIMGDLSRTSKWVGNRRQQARMDNMVKELFGENTGDATAAAMARAWEKVSEDLRVRFNAAGGAIGKLERWGLPQTHNRLALLDFKREPWVEYMMQEGVLDRDRTINHVTGQKLTDADLRAALEDIWEKITTDGWSNMDVSAQPKGKGALYSQHADHRFLHFKNADAWLAYAKRFGNNDPFGSIMGHVSMMARDIAHLETFGPNPNAMRQWMRSWLQKMAAEQDPRRIIADELNDRIKELQREAAGLPGDEKFANAFAAVTSAVDSIMKTVADIGQGKRPEADMGRAIGVLDTAWSNMGDWPDASRRSEIGKQITRLMEELRNPPTVAEGKKRIVDYVRTKLNRADQYWQGMRGVEPGNKHAAEIMQSVRNFISATSLGAAWFSSLNDPAFGQDMRARIGMGFAQANFGRVMALGLKELITRGTRDDAIDAMLGLDAAQNVLRKKAAEVRGIDHGFWTGWLADRTLTWGLLSPWTQAGKHVVGRDLMTFLGSHAGTSFDQLPTGLQAALTTHGFDRASWDKIRHASLHDGKRLRPNEIMELDKALGERYIQMILRETRYAVPEGTVASRTIMTGAGAPGTVVGEMARSFGQFKGFGVAVLMLHAGRIAREIIAAEGGAKARPAAYAGALIITSTLLGAMSMALKDVKDGRDPRKWLDEDTWLDPKHWGAAFLQSGGLGIYGDLLFSETNRFGGGLEGTVAGPLVGRVADVLKIGAEVNAAMEGKKTNFTKWGVQLGRRDVPFVNHWLTSLVYQRMVMDQLLKMGNPEGAAGLQRQMAKRRKDYGQDYYWRMGDTAPSRAPDLTRILATR